MEAKLICNTKWKQIWHTQHLSRGCHGQIMPQWEKNKIGNWVGSTGAWHHLCEHRNILLVPSAEGRNVQTSLPLAQDRSPMLSALAHFLPFKTLLWGCEPSAMPRRPSSAMSRMAPGLHPTEKTRKWRQSKPTDIGIHRKPRFGWTGPSDGELSASQSSVHLLYVVEQR